MSNRRPRSIIDEIATIVRRGSESLDVVTGMSYRHPNGFDKISLDYSHLETVTRRIHLWWPEGTDPLDRERTDCAESDVHNHPWGFTSQVLMGSIRNDTFDVVEPAPGAIQFEAYRIEIPPGGPKNKPFSVPIGVQYARRSGARVLHKGDRYALESETLHRIVPLGERPASTLVSQQPLSRRSSTVLRQANIEPRVKVKHRKFTRREIRVLLGALLDVLVPADPAHIDANR